ncbi:hypothetical protein EDB85DRAFT_2159541 [Lactarius pseudohatsudake]|nr:hypothetical protein EDB85DRAFT_2159541 [Lactarius pseudohatsudake]
MPTSETPTSEYSPTLTPAPTRFLGYCGGILSKATQQLHSPIPTARRSLRLTASTPEYARSDDADTRDFEYSLTSLAARFLHHFHLSLDSGNNVILALRERFIWAGQFVVTGPWRGGTGTSLIWGADADRVAIDPL